MDITGIGSIADIAGKIIDKIWPKADPTEKLKAQFELQKILEERENAIIEAQKSIIVAEMQQADPYTKRARPTIVYAGLLAIFLVHVILPYISYFARETYPGIALPTDFWYVWGGVSSIWFVGRTMERRRNDNPIIKSITGAPK